MSWDLFVFNVPPEMENLDNVEPDHELAPIGLRKDVVARILEAAPETDFSDSGSWGTLIGDSWSIEFSINDDEPCTCFALHVRGTDEVIEVIADILDKTGLRAFDVGSNAFFKRPQALASFQAWGAFRDGMAARIQGEPD